MNMLPNGWVEATLADVTIPRGEKADPSTLGEMPFLGMDHIEAHTAKLLGHQPVSELKSSVAVFKKGDLLYGRLRPYLNKVHLTEFDGAASAEFIVFPPSNAIEQRFLQSLLRSPEYRTLADQRSTGDRPRVKFENVSDYSFPLPPLPEQRRIVTKLDTLSNRTTAARSHLSAVTKLVERHRQSVIDAIFAPYELTIPLLDLVDPDIGIPYGIVQTGEHNEGGIPTVRAGDIKNFQLLEEGLKRVAPNIADQYGRTQLKGGEVLIAIRGSVGETCVVPSTMKGNNISREVALVPVAEDTDATFIMYFLRSIQAAQYIKANIKGVAQTGINLRDLKRLPCPDLSAQAQKDIVFQIEAAFAKIDRLAREAEKALKLTSRLEERILSKAFKGELVPQDPCDEPASVLLERIRAERAIAPKPKLGRRKKIGATN